MHGNRGCATARRLEGRGPFEVDFFHATPIGIMLNAEKFAGDRSPPPPGAATHACEFEQQRTLSSEDRRNGKVITI